MKPIGQTRALDRLKQIKADLKFQISNYENRAKSCLTCETQGACCVDAHFVNVHISRLEAIAIKNALDVLPSDLRKRVEQRVDAVISKYGLSTESDTFAQTYACPLFEQGTGCLVHESGKPTACIVHACYETRADLPPDDLQTSAERQIDDLNTRTYGGAQPWLPIPLAIKR